MLQFLNSLREERGYPEPEATRGMIERKWRNDETISASVNATRLSLSDDSVSYRDIESLESHLRRKRNKRKGRKNRQDGDPLPVRPVKTSNPSILRPFRKPWGKPMEGGRKGRVDTGMQGRTKRKVGWKPLEIESIKPRATPPSPSLHRWLDRSKDSHPKWRKSTFNRFRSGLIFDRIRYMVYDLKSLNREAMITRF